MNGVLNVPVTMNVPDPQVQTNGLDSSGQCIFWFYYVTIPTPQVWLSYPSKIYLGLPKK